MMNFKPILFLFGMFLLVGTLGFVSADYRFEDTGGTELVRIYSDSGNLSVSGNVSSDYFVGSGKYLTDIDVNQIDLSDYYLQSVANSTFIFRSEENTLNVNSSTYWADLSGYVSRWFRETGGQLDFNEELMNSTIDSKIAEGQSSLAVNSSQYWDNLDSPADILGSQINNDLSWVELSQLVSFVGNWSQDKVDYYLKTQVYNQSEVDTMITSGDVNSSNYWDDLDTPADIKGSQIDDDLDWVEMAEIVSLVGNWSQDKVDYYLKTQVYSKGETYNRTEVEDLIGSGDVDTLDGYDASYFMPLNKSVYGDFDFNSGWTDGGVSIIGGNVYAQSGYFYDINSISVSTLAVNGSIVPESGFDNQFDVGSSSLRWNDAHFGGAVNAGSFVGDGSSLTGITGSQIDNDLNWISASNLAGEESDPLWTGNYSSRTGTGNVVYSNSPSLTTPNIGAATAGGNLNMASNKITSLANGTAAQDAVSYSQLQAVNSQLSGDISDSYVPYTGATKNVDLGGNDLSTAGTINTGLGAMEVGDTVVTDGDTSSVPTGNAVYDFVDGNYYLKSNPNNYINSSNLAAAESDPHWTGNMSSVGFLNQAETVTSRWAFNGGTSGSTSPFTVDSNTVVTNLNADLLDGQNGAYYLDNTDTQDLGVSGNTITLTDGGSVTAPYATNAGDADTLDGHDSSYFATAASSSDDQTLTEVLASGNSAGTYDINMNDNLITNIGVAGTDFTSGGGLTLAGTFDPNGAITLPTTGISGAGSGSGLDADKLDGIDSASFLQSSDLASYVTGPASSTDNAIVRYNGATGKIIQNSGATIDDSGNAVFATINTGQGANELYDMNQNVLTTSAVTFATINTGLGAMEVGDTAVTDGDTSSVPTGNAVYDFVTGSGYLTSVSYSDLTGSPSDRITTGNHISWTGDTLNVADDWYDSIGDLPTGTISDGDTTHIATNDEIHDFVTSQGYSTTNGDITGVGAGSGLTGGGVSGSVTLNVGGSGTIDVAADSISVSADSIGDTQLAYNTGQHLTTGSSPTFAGGTMTGDLTFTDSTEGIKWVMNTDGAGINFKNAGDSDTDSYLHFYTADNGNEYFKWSIDGIDVMDLKGTSGDLSVDGTITATAFVGDGSGLTGIDSAVTDVWVNTSGDTMTGDLTMSASDIVFGSNGRGIISSTSDGADNRNIKFAGGGGFSSTRGAVMILSGNEDATYGGNVQINPGGNAGAQVQLDGTVYVGDGKVGIGTTSPLSYKLAVQGGDMRVTGNTDTRIIVGDSLSADDYGQLQWDTTGNFLSLESGGTSRQLVLQKDGGNVGIGTTSPSGTLKLDVEGQIGATQYCDEAGANCIDIASVSDGTISEQLGLAESGVTRIVNPQGATYNGGSGAVGALEIILPASGIGTSTMLKLTVEVFDYTTDESITLKVGGYSYGTVSWVNTYAQVIGSKTDRDFTVRFGHMADNRSVIYIGDVDTTWSYPKVAVTEVLATHSGTAVDTWDDGWDVNLVTTLASDIDRVHNNNLLASDWNKLKNIPAGISDGDNKVAIDSAATPDYIGATGSVGVLRASSPISYTDGGNYVTLGITNDAITDTQLAYNTGQHLTTTSSPTFSDLTLSGGDLIINNNNGGINFNDANAYWLKTATNWGLYWDTTNNQLDFMGSGTERGYIDLDNGNAQFDGTMTANAFVGDGSGLTNIDAGDVEDIWVNESGDTMTGALTVNSGSYNDHIKLIRGTLGGSITIGGNGLLLSGNSDSSSSSIVRNDGFVGVNTPYPDYPLTVKSNTVASYVQNWIDSNDNEGAKLYVDGETGDQNEGAFLYLGNPTGANSNAVKIDSRRNVDSYFNSGGSVGIGTTTPSGTLKLDVEGQVGATEYCDENGANCFNYVDVTGGDGYIGEAQAHTAGGALNMNNNLITNIGNAGTDFTSGGGLTLAGTFDPNGAVTLPTTGISGAGAGSGLNADLLDGLNSARFSQFDTDTYTSGAATAGWVTVASSSGSRGFGEVYVWDIESGDHSFIHLNWMRSYADTGVTVVNSGGHSRRLTGFRVIRDSDVTYGQKKLQVYSTTSSTYRVRVKDNSAINGFTTISASTPTTEGLPSGWVVQGSEITSLTEAGGHIATTGTVTATSFVGDGSQLTGISTEDVKVAIDSGATADYIGATGSAGVLRASSPISYTDGGNYVTLGITGNSITDTHLAYNTGQHLTTTSTPTFNQLNIASGTGNGVRFWSSDSYEISMGNAADYQFGPVDDYSIKTAMSNTAGRGWTWGVVGSTPVAAIEATTGDMEIEGDMTAESYKAEASQDLVVDGTTGTGNIVMIIG